MGIITVYTNYETGNDANDGLTPGTAMKSVMGAYSHVLSNIVYDASTRVVIQMAPGVDDLDSVHGASHALHGGAQGGAALVIEGSVDGNGKISRIITDVPECFALYFGGPVMLKNLELSSTHPNGVALNCRYGAQVYIGSGVRFGACGARHISISDYGLVICGGPYSITGNAPYHIVNSGGTFERYSVAVDITVPMTVATFILAQYPGMTMFGGPMPTGGPVIGRAYSTYGGAYLGGGASVPGSLPGAL